LTDKLETVSHVSVNGLVFREADPKDIFAGQKLLVPDKSAQGNVSIVTGSNWFGEPAIDDKTPIRTLKRAVGWKLIVPDDAPAHDKAYLAEIKHYLGVNWKPFGSFLNVPLEGGTATHYPHPALVNVFTCGLNESNWNALVHLVETYEDDFVRDPQERPIFTSLSEMLEGTSVAAFGNDRRLQQFWLLHGIHAAMGLDFPDPFYRNVYRGRPLESYEEIMAHYNVLTVPPDVP